MFPLLLQDLVFPLALLHGLRHEDDAATDLVVVLELLAILLGAMRLQQDLHHLVGEHTPVTDDLALLVDDGLVPAKRPGPGFHLESVHRYLNGFLPQFGEVRVFLFLGVGRVAGSPSSSVGCVGDVAGRRQDLDEPVLALLRVDLLAFGDLGEFC